MYRTDTIIDAPSGGVPSPGHPTANAVRLRPTLLGIASAHPPFRGHHAGQLGALVSAHVTAGSVRAANRRVDSSAEAPHHVGPGYAAGSLCHAHRRPDGSPCRCRHRCGLAFDQPSDRGFRQGPRRQLRDGLLDRLRQSRSRSPVSQRAWAAVGFAAHLHRPHGLLCGAQRHQGRHGQRGRTTRRAGDLQLHRAQFGPRPRHARCPTRIRRNR